MPVLFYLWHTSLHCVVFFFSFFCNLTKFQLNLLIIVKMILIIKIKIEHTANRSGEWEELEVEDGRYDYVVEFL